jgi:hypothetical protein
MKKSGLRLLIMGSISVAGICFACHEGGIERNIENRCTEHRDCREPYICDTGFCRPQCEDDDDCPDGKCIRSSIDSEVKVCAGFEAETGDDCHDGSCRDPKICAPDGVCRSQCESDDDCDHGMFCFQYACFENVSFQGIDGGLELHASEGVCAGVNCSDHGDCVDNNGIAECRCDLGYKKVGLTCLFDSCYEITCSDNGVCIDDGTGAQCICDPGYKQEGLDCLIDVCYQVNCTFNSSCVDRDGTATCECDPGFKEEGELCIYDPCFAVECTDNSTCVDIGGIPGCLCDEGYKPSGQVCIVDVCYEEECSDHGYCVDNYGTAVCQCDLGYKAVGLKCENDPCYQEYCSYNGVCVDNDGVAECHCYENYHAEELSCIHDNRDPLAYNDNVTTWLNVPVTIRALDNDIDQDGDPLTIIDIDEPTNGSAEIASEDNAIRYTPDTDFIGQDSFSYTVSDGEGGDDGAALVYVTVEQDTAVPGTIADLRALYSGEENTIDLTWTATGNDGIYGLAKAYELKISNTPITDENFNSAESYLQEWEPLGYGQSENYQIDLDWYSGIWYFAIKVLDGVPQSGAISNILQVNTDVSASYSETHDFGEVAVGLTSSAYITVNHNSDDLVDLIILSIELTGSSDYHFIDEENIDDEVRLEPGDYHSIGVLFQPTVAGGSSAQLTIHYDVSDSTLSYIISLVGTGI